MIGSTYPKVKFGFGFVLEGNVLFTFLPEPVPYAEIAFWVIP
jgi:hypothetical protein